MYTLFSNKQPYESDYKTLKEMKKYIRERAKQCAILDKHTSVVRFVKFADGQTFYYIKKRKK